MAIENHPTRTRRIEVAWLRDINRRFRKFKRVTRERLESTGKDVQANNAFDNDPLRLRAYLAWYEQQIAEILVGSPQAPNWQARYQIASYQRGLDRTRATLTRQGISTTITQADRTAAQSLTGGLGVLPPAEFGLAFEVSTVSVFPVHQTAIEFLTTRSYDRYTNWTTQLSTNARQILTDGARQGLGIDELTRQLFDATDVTRSRARTIARTETIQAFQRSTIEESKRIALETGEDVKLIWITARDSKVRDLHAGWHGDIGVQAD